MSVVERLPHQPPMRLIDAVVEFEPGVSATTTRRTQPTDFFFQGHFPHEPIVPAIILVELVAQTGGLAASAEPGVGEEPVRLRLAAIGAFKFPASAGPHVTLETRARVAGRVGRLIKVEGSVTADGVLVATGSLTLAG